MYVYTHLSFKISSGKRDKAGYHQRVLISYFYIMSQRSVVCNRKKSEEYSILISQNIVIEFIEKEKGRAIISKLGNCP